MRLVVNHSSGFSADLWGWDLEVTQAESQPVELVWRTSCYEPQSKQEHRARAAALPQWCTELLSTVDSLDLSAFTVR